MLIIIILPGTKCNHFNVHLDRVKRIWYLSPMRAATVQASLRIRAVSPEPPLLAHTSSESRGTFRQKARSLAPLNGWACAVKICHDGMLDDTNSRDGAHIKHRLTMVKVCLLPLRVCGPRSFPFVAMLHANGRAVVEKESPSHRL